MEDSPSLASGFKRLVAGIKRLGFNPPPEADPDSERGSADEEGSGREDTPTVLTKLQKWGGYAAVGQPLGPTRFLPMKTPMSQEILDTWSLPHPCSHPLTVKILVDDQERAGRRVGAIIDLANHECLYLQDIPISLQHIEVQLVAKATPPRAAVDAVAAAAAKVWARDPEAYIAIHCAYGFNRTGFVLCSYLCQVCGLSVDQALAAFATSRPPGVKHAAFIAELHRRYDPGEGGLPRSASDDELAAAATTPGGRLPRAAQLPPLAPGSTPTASEAARRRDLLARSLARSPFKPVADVVGGSLTAALRMRGRQSGSPALSTSTSVDSEAHSLGFGSREVLRQLRNEHQDGAQEQQEAQSAHTRLAGLFDHASPDGPRPASETSEAEDPMATFLEKIVAPGAAAN